MTGMLASVTNQAEAEIVMAEGVEIIDLKNPSEGALGAVSLSTIAQIVGQVDGRFPVSATIGDVLDMNPHTVCGRVRCTADAGVDFVKVGLFPGPSLAACLEALGREAQRGARLVAVLFADRSPSMAFIDTLATNGFVGAMLDTVDKGSGSLTNIMTERSVAQFVQITRRKRLLSGLAGSLRLSDIAPLARLHPDYLGFRGALCEKGMRTQVVVRTSVAAVRREVERASLLSQRLRTSSEMPLASNNTAVNRFIC